MKIALTVAVTGLTTAAIGFAAPASAGCEFQAFAKYCDGPVRPDGTWDRCFETTSQPFYGQYGQIAGYVPVTGRCYPVDPNAFPQFPLGQPLYHIYP